MEPKLSVIIPCYNNGNLLSKMIDCILNQSFDSWELIVVDDGSTDNTFSIVESYSHKDNRIKCLKRNRLPKGSVTCRNIGFDNSVGKYIIHFDADDLISKDCFRNRVSFMENNPSVDYASFPAKSFTVESNLPNINTPGKTWGEENDDVDILSKFLRNDYPFSVWNNIYKRSSIVNLRWDENVKIYTDFSYIIPGIFTGLKHKFSHNTEVDYFYRVADNPGNMCSSFVSEEKCISTIYLFKKILKLLESRDISYKKDFMEYVILHYERLAYDGDIIKIQQYILEMSSFYPIKSRLNLVTSFVKPFRKNKKIHKAVLYLLLYLFFGYKKYLMTLFNQFIQLFKPNKVNQ